VKSILQSISHRIAAHWKTSLIGAIEGSGLIVGGSIVTDPKLANGAYALAAYLFIKGLLAKDAAK
jgi:hypothetical protein